MRIIGFINRHEKKLTRLLVFCGIVLMSLLFVLMVYPRSTIEGRVVEKFGSGTDRNTNQGRIVIKEPDGETLTLANQDNLLMEKNDQVKNFQQEIKIGQTYSFKLVGISVKELKVYPNIIEYKASDPA